MLKKATLLLLTLSLTLAPISGYSEDKSYGGELVVGDNNRPTLINPLLVNTGIAASVDSLVFSCLVRMSPKGKLEPELAESWEVSKDQRAYTFYLRHGVKFHDGVELTSADVLFTFQKIKDPASNCPYRLTVSNVEFFAAPDAYTFYVVLKKPQQSLLHDLYHEILPKHLYENGSLRENQFNRKPVGTGPFKFKEWTSDRIVLEANENFFEGRPHLDQIVFKSYENIEEVWSALMRGEIDLMKFISVNDYELTQKDPAFKTYAFSLSDYYVISYNLDDPLLSDIRFRQAINHAVDRKQLIERAERGYGVESTGPFHPNSPAYNPSVQPCTYDPAQALKILETLGLKDKPVELRMLVDARQGKMRKIALILRQQLQEVGVRLRLELCYDDAEMKKHLSSKDFQARLVMFSGHENYPDETIKRWHSRYEGRGEFWGTQFADPEIDRLIEEGRVSQNWQASKKIYRQLHETLYQKQPACFLYFPYAFHAVSNRLSGTDKFFSLAYVMDFYLKDFYVTQSLKKGGEAHGGDSSRHG